MAEDKRGIKELPAEVKSQLRSGVVITNMAQCIVELVLNALDAGATSIAVRVNFNYFKVQVIDNGSGMNLEELDMVGERFMTSKCHSMNDLCYNLNHFGFRGEALASIREISGLLILESRPRNNDMTYSKAFSHGKAHKPTISKTERAGHGTTITVHDFMYNMPVRRQRFQSAIDLEEIKSNIESIALIQPQASFSLRNDTNGSLILHTRKCSDTITAFSHLFGQTFLSTLVNVTSTLSEFKISGYISKEGHYQKNLQFVYVNKRLVLRTKLHKLANSMLGNSVLLKTNNTANDVPISNDATIGKWLAFSPPRREKHAVYVLNVECPFHAYDICLDPKKTLIEFCDWDTVLKCLETLIRTFLEKEFSISLRQEDEGIDIGCQKVALNEEVKLSQNEMYDKKSEFLKKCFKEKPRKFSYSGSTMRKMVLASRIVKGMAAKRKHNEEKRQIGSDNNLKESEQKIYKQPENGEIFESVRNGNVESFTEHSHQSKPDKSKLENPFFSSQMQNVTQRSTDLFGESGIIPADKIRKKLCNIPHCASEIPVTSVHFQKTAITKCDTQSSVDNLALDKESDICPIVKFKKSINERNLVSRTKLWHKNVAPIVKFRDKANLSSGIQFELEKKTAVIPLKLFKHKPLKKISINSNVNKHSQRIKDNRDESILIETEGITVNGYIRPPRKGQAHKNFRHISSRISSDVKDVFNDNVGYDVTIGKNLKTLKHFRGNNSTHHLLGGNVREKFNNMTNKNVTAEEASRNIPHYNRDNSEVNCLKVSTKNRSKPIFEITKKDISLKGMKNVNISAIVREEISSMLKSEMCDLFDISKIYTKLGTLSNFKSDCLKHFLRQEECSHENMEHKKQISSKVGNMHNSVAQNFCTSSDFLQTVTPGLSKEEAIISCNNVSLSRKHTGNINPILKFQEELQDHDMGSYSNCNKSTEHNFEEDLDCDVLDCLQRNEITEKQCSNSEIETDFFKFSPKAKKQDKTYFEDLFGISNNENGLCNSMPEERMHIQQSEFSSSGEPHEKITCKIMQAPGFDKSSHSNNLYSKGICSNRPASVPRDVKIQLYQRENMILSSGSEADMELSNKSEPEIRKKKSTHVTLFNKASSMHKLRKSISVMTINKNSCCYSNETIKRKVCNNKFSEITEWDMLSRKPNLWPNENTEDNLQSRNKKSTINSGIIINEEFRESEINTVGVDCITSSGTIISCSNPSLVNNEIFSNNTLSPSSKSSIFNCNYTATCEKTICESSPFLVSRDTNRSVVSDSVSEICNQIFISNKSSNCPSEEVAETSAEHAKVNEEDTTARINDLILYPDKNLNISNDEVLNFETCEGKINSICNSKEKVNFYESSSSPELITWMDNIEISSLGAKPTDDHQNEPKEINGKDLAIDKLSSYRNNTGELDAVNFNRIEYVQDKVEDHECSYSEHNQLSMSKSSTPLSAVISSGSSNNHAINYELNVSLLENVSTVLDNRLNKENHVDSCGNVDSHVMENLCISASGNANNDCLTILDSIWNSPVICQDLLIKDESASINTENGNKCIESVEVSEKKSNCDRSSYNDSPRQEIIVNLNNTPEDENYCDKQVLENDGIFNVSQSSEVNKEAIFTPELVKSKESQEEKEFLKVSNRKRRSETHDQNVHRKKACTYNSVNNSTVYPTEDNYLEKTRESESELLNSKTISTQELNEAFDKIINIIPCVDLQEDYRLNVNNIQNGATDENASEKEAFVQEGQANLNEFDKLQLEPHIKNSKGWEERVDSDGKTYFIHKQTGRTSFTAPNYTAPPNVYSMKERFGFLPKGFSPILKDCIAKCNVEAKKILTPSKCEALKNVVENCADADDVATVKWKNEEELKREGCRDLVKEMLEVSDTRMQYCEKEIANAAVQELPKNIVKVYNIMYPCAFKKDIFSNLKVLGQLDNKFIVAVVEITSGLKQNLIVLFDQHAVHERIRLENLLKEYHLEGSDGEFRSSDINPHINLKLNDKEYRIISSFQKDFERLGLLLQLLDDNEIKVTGVPTCLLARELREVQGRGTSVLKDHLENMIREQVESILVTRGIGVKMPTILQSVISSEACKGALKFGDPLFLDECEILLQSLSECQVPFQCAHGRPALVPIVDLKYLQSQQNQIRPKPKLWKLSKQTK